MTDSAAWYWIYKRTVEPGLLEEMIKMGHSYYEIRRYQINHMGGISYNKFAEQLVEHYKDEKGTALVTQEVLLFV